MVPVPGFGREGEGRRGGKRGARLARRAYILQNRGLESVVWPDNEHDDNAFSLRILFKRDYFFSWNGRRERDSNSNSCRNPICLPAMPITTSARLMWTRAGSVPTTSHLCEIRSTALCKMLPCIITTTCIHLLVLTRHFCLKGWGYIARHTAHEFLHMMCECSRVSVADLSSTTGSHIQVDRRPARPWLSGSKARCAPDTIQTTWCTIMARGQRRPLCSAWRLWG